MREAQGRELVSPPLAPMVSGERQLSTRPIVVDGLPLTKGLAKAGNAMP